MGVKIYRGWTILVFVIAAIGLPLLGVYALTSSSGRGENEANYIEESVEGSSLSSQGAAKNVADWMIGDESPVSKDVSVFFHENPLGFIFCLVFFILFWVIFILVSVLNHGLSIGAKKGRFEGVGVSARWV